MAESIQGLLLILDDLDGAKVFVYERGRPIDRPREVNSVLEGISP